MPKEKQLIFAENHIRYMKQLQQYLHKMKTDSGHRAFCGASSRKDTCKSAEDEVTHKMALNELTGRLFEDLKKEQHLV